MNFVRDLCSDAGREPDVRGGTILTVNSQAMNPDSRNQTDKTLIDKDSTPTETVEGSRVASGDTPQKTELLAPGEAPDSQRLGPEGAPTQTEPLSAGDKERIRPPTPAFAPPYDQQVTIRHKPPAFKHPSVVMRPAWIRAGILVAIPLLLWGLTLALPRKGDASAFDWVVSATAAPAGSVALRPRADGGALPALVIARRDNHLEATSAPVSPDAGSWRFPTTDDGALIGTTLNDAVLWIPREGPFALKTAPPQEPVLVVFWSQGEASSGRVRLSFVDRAGKEIRTHVLDGGASPGRCSWVSTSQGPALAYAPPGGSPMLYDIQNGTSLIPGR